MSLVVLWVGLPAMAYCWLMATLDGYFVPATVVIGVFLVASCRKAGL